MARPMTSLRSTQQATLVAFSEELAILFNAFRNIYFDNGSKHGNSSDFVELSPLSSAAQERIATELHGPAIDR